MSFKPGFKCFFPVTILAVRFFADAPCIATAGVMCLQAELGNFGIFTFFQ